MRGLWSLARGGCERDDPKYHRNVYVSIIYYCLVLVFESAERIAGNALQ